YNDVKSATERRGGLPIDTPVTLFQIREATNEYIGGNSAQSHLWWQGIDSRAAVRIVGKSNAIHHFHAKDTFLTPDNVNMYGLTDMPPYQQVGTRAWTFRTVGYGHSPYEWGEMISQLRSHGYDYVLSIEHEDPIMSVEEGFHKAVENLKSVNIYDQAPDMWWA
ncbi:sugar phosphate isomerase/epimerase, partial [Staphylococcus pseudintermedius]|uniref:sugar phosphate isomerase/epimerase family protein n=1 Tax=Staphylococcus pseudintermedius TaxID=283734 RepID=UPI000E372574